ncbi:MAG: multidrug effflux MFS transporter [Chloroflexi bacterium]|nr:MAG: multidrug effflux MFS transporter [Chloroflexota bacterium]
MATASMTLPARARMFVILGGLTAFGPLSIDMYLPALPAIGRELSASESLIQLTLTGCLVGLAAGQVIGGPFSDTLGRRRPLLAGVAAYVVTSLLCALAPSAPLLAVLRLLQGLGGGAGIVIARAVVRDLYEGVAAARYFSRLVLVMGLAPILAPVLGGQLLRFTSWRGIFLMLSLITALLWIAAASALPETLGEERRRGGDLAGVLRTFRGLAGDTPFLLYALTGALGFGAMFAYIAGSPFVLEGIYRASPQLFSLFFGLNAFGFMLASQINGSLVSHIAPGRLLALGVSLNAAAGCALLAVVLLGGLGLPAVLPPLFLLVSSVGFVIPNATALALSRHPEAAGTGSALLGVIQSGIAAVAAPLVGIAGSRSALPMAAVIAACGAGALAALVRRRPAQDGRAERRPDRPEARAATRE